MKTNKKEDIIDLLKIVPMPPGYVIPNGLTEKEIMFAENRIGIYFPNELKEWLQISNGPCVGPGGIFGVTTDKSSLNIEEILSIYDSWRSYQWVPIAGDGLGNYYIIDTTKKTKHGHQIFFIDTSEDMQKPAYLVATNIWIFLKFLLEKELGIIEWPFNKEYVTKMDPEFSNCPSEIKPWEAN